MTESAPAPPATLAGASPCQESARVAPAGQGSTVTRRARRASSASRANRCVAVRTARTATASLDIVSAPQDSWDPTARCPAPWGLTASTAPRDVAARMERSVPLWTVPARVNQGGTGWTAPLTAPVEPGAWAVITPASVTTEEPATP